MSSPSAPSIPDSRHALVVDDHQDSARSLEVLLQGLGYQTEVASNGIEALRKAASLRPAVVFLDISMPKLDGFDTSGVIRAQSWGRDVLLVAVTGLSPDDIRERALASFDEYLFKPVQFPALEEIHARLMARAGSVK